MSGKEKPCERKLINALVKNGFYAMHMDCSVDGFPDTIAIKGNDVLLIEVKEAKANDKVIDVFESSQPVFGYQMVKVGFTRTFSAICDSRTGLWTISNMQNLLHSIFENADYRIKDMPALVSSGTLGEVILFFMRITKEG